jgi:hypothetical protein
MENTLTTELLKETLQTLTTVKDFAVEQAPLVLQEIIAWTMVKPIFPFIVLIGFVLCILYILPKIQKFFSDDFEPCMWSAVVLYGCALGSAIVTFIMIVNAVKCIIAPRLFLIDYITELLK